MRSRLFIVTVLFANMYLLSASATEYPLDVTLVYPHPKKWINQELCKQPGDDVFFQISWKAGNVVTPWDTSKNADVYLSKSEECRNKDIQIGDEDDVSIGVDEFEGRYPENKEDLTLADLKKTLPGCDSGEEDDYFFCIEWIWNFSNTEQKCIGGAPIRIDFKVPEAPTLTSINPGENNLRVNWERPSDDDLAGYKIYYRPKDTPNADPSVTTITEKTSTQGKIQPLENGVTYVVWMTAIDEAENESIESDQGEGTPMPVDDFFELYKKAGGVEEGGYCFVATAAYGSYQHGMVQPLRDFRDDHLAQSPAGRSIIDGYYRYGPLWARSLQGSETTKGFARILLLPLVLFAWLSGVTGPFGAVVTMACVPALLAFLLVCLIRRKKRFGLPRSGVMGLLLVVGLFFTAAPEAKASEESNYQLQIRFGFYYPSVDDEFTTAAEKPFHRIYGSDSQFMFELGVDYQIWKGFGTLTTGGTIGFVQYLGKALTEAAGEPSSDTTVFNLVPVRLTVGYHFDYLQQNMGVPLVPYAAAGISYYLWWVLDGLGNVAQWEDTAGNKYSAEGGIFGYHVAVGLKFLLDVLEPDAAANLAADVGVYNTYIFGEYNLSRVDGFGSGDHLKLGDDVFMFGLMMEF